MQDLTVKEIAIRWNISEQTVRYYCRNGRIPGAYQNDNSWFIPADAPKPTKIEILEDVLIPRLARRLQSQKKKNNYHGLYDYVQIYFAYCSSRMASNRLTKDQVETIFKKGKVVSKFEPMKVSDCIEVMNHFVCVDYIIDHVMEPITQRFLKKLHYLLMFGSVDDRLGKVVPGEFRPAAFEKAGRNLPPADTINKALSELIQDYESIDEVILGDILNFHVEFEKIAPFRDGNGRVGRLIMFKECLRHAITPFILDDKRRTRYLDGIKKWSSRRKVLTEVISEAQERFENAVDSHRLHEHGQNFVPEDYEE